MTKQSHFVSVECGDPTAQKQKNDGTADSCETKPFWRLPRRPDLWFGTPRYDAWWVAVLHQLLVWLTDCNIVKFQVVGQRSPRVDILFRQAPEGLDLLICRQKNTADKDVYRV